ncbi:hypothetical protein LDENG_00024110 [Lucifuga dentata]|nr:hypothetical protein LDENG_00024110 [Lucifuga dentata]
MRGDKRSSSYHKEKPSGLSRALSWLSVSTLSRQTRGIFHSQSELHTVHSRRSYSQSHAHLDREDDDNWVYHPQHKIGENRERKREGKEVKEVDSCQMGRWEHQIKPHVI